jgi:hypothetical protein
MSRWFEAAFAQDGIEGDFDLRVVYDLAKCAPYRLGIRTCA